LHPRTEDRGVAAFKGRIIHVGWAKKPAIGAAAAATVALPGTVRAEDFILEGKTVAWIVGFREGGGTDRLTRVPQTKLGENPPGNPNQPERHRSEQARRWLGYRV